MVLQQGQAVPVWGNAGLNAQVTVEFAGQVKTTTADNDGRWRVDLDALSASSTAQTFTVSSGAETIEYTNVLVGEVWLCSGQSNMAWSRNKDLTQADRPLIRIYRTPAEAFASPQETVDEVWEVCTPTVAAGSSSVAYYYGVKLQEQLGVPIGLLMSAWGGTKIQPWTPRIGFESVSVPEEFVPEFQSIFAEIDDLTEDGKQGKATAIYNGMIHPHIPFAIKGAIWYQGESNVADGMLYRYWTEAQVNGWRQLWGYDFPYYFVQLAPFDYSQHPSNVLPEFWEAQSAIVEAIPNTGMAVISDVGEPDNIHPADKETPGTRLALLALDNTYGYDIVSTGPVFNSMVINGNTIEVYFDSAVGLTTSDGLAPDWFEIAEDYSGFTPAVATIVNDHVVLSSPTVTLPEAMRFAWNEVAMPNLVNGAGLVASAFRAGEVEPPLFTSDPINEIDAEEDVAYSSSIADDAFNPQGGPMTFLKVSGPAWLTVASDGTLSGTPGTADLGDNVFIVQVDANVGSDTATLNITVLTEQDIFEAEDATLSGPIIKSDVAGYTGTGYVDYPSTASGDYVEWTVTSASGGDFDIAFRYTLSDADGRPLEIKVNGNVVAASLSFPGTGGWANWDMTAPLSVTLNAGENTIRATSIGSSGGNIDSMVVYGDLLGDPVLRFTSDPINEIDATEDVAYSSTIADDAVDPDSNPMTFSLVSGPAWLSVAANGDLTGTPGTGDVGVNVFTVQVDSAGGSDTATLNITVLSSTPVIDKPDVYLVSNTSKGGDPEAAAMTEFLQARFGGQLGTITTDEYNTVGAIPAAGAGDLVIFLRTLNNGDYDDAGEPAAWNALEAGILMLSPFQPDVDNLGWVTTTSQNELTSAAGAETAVTADSLFNGVTVTGGYADLITDGTVYKAAQTAGFDASEVLGTATMTAAGDSIVLARIAAGTAWDASGAAGAPSGTHGGDRIVFNFLQNPGLVADDLTADGQTVLENAIDELLPDPPAFSSDPITKPNATEDRPYSGTIADVADNPEGGPMIFSKEGGPDWLSVASNGDLSGTPGDSDTNDVPNVFTVKVDATGGSDTVTLNIEVLNTYSGVRGIEDLAGLAGEWLSVDCTDSPACGGADLDDDTDVTLSDLAIFAGNWLAGT